MKHKILKFSITILLPTIIGVMFLGAGCEKENEQELSEIVEGYIVGSFVCWEEDRITGELTGNKTDRGYCILLKGSNNEESRWPMDFYTFNLPPGLFDFPDEILAPFYNSNDGGPIFFPGNLQDNFKIQFTYRISNESEIVHFTNGHYFMAFPFLWEKYKQVSIIEISKVE